MKSVFSLFFILYLCSTLSGQTISGLITDSESNPISQVQVLIRDKENPELIREFTRSKPDGSYLLTSKTKFDYFIIEFKKVEYFPLKYEFQRSEIQKDLRIDIIMQEEEEISLEEVLIKTEQKITLKKDTTNYKVSAFLDGSERKVEDLLKKKEQYFFP